MTVYLDCNATTPIEPAVRDIVLHYMEEEFGNAGSRTHEFGARAQEAVQKARDQVAAVVNAKREEVIFTSGATESNNLAILGLAPHGEKHNKRHIISTQIEHKAVLEPLEHLRTKGFEVEFVPPTTGGWVEPDEIKKRLRKDTLLVSVMHANNETGVLQPLDEIAKVLEGHEAYFHTDAAQGFGKELEMLKSPRIDLISISGHKIYAPKGIGALITRRRGFDRVPLTPLMFGGGQERGLRPGTVPVHLVAGLGLASSLAVKDFVARRQKVQQVRKEVLAAFLPLSHNLHGDQNKTLPHVLNLSFSGVDSEAVMLIWKGMVAISNGAACTSHEYSISYVLRAMGIQEKYIRASFRLSWSHFNFNINWSTLNELIQIQII